MLCRYTHDDVKTFKLVFGMHHTRRPSSSTQEMQGSSVAPATGSPTTSDDEETTYRGPDSVVTPEPKKEPEKKRIKVKRSTIIGRTENKNSSSSNNVSTPQSMSSPTLGKRPTLIAPGGSGDPKNRLSMVGLLAGGVSGAGDAEMGIDRGISDLDNMSVVCALFLTIFASFSASVNREEQEPVPEGKFLTEHYVRKFWEENFYGVALAVFSMCFCFALRTSLYLNANAPKKLVSSQLKKWDQMFIYDVMVLRVFVVAEAVLVARVSGYVYAIKNPYDDLNEYGHSFTTVCGVILMVYLLSFCFRHMHIVGALPSWSEIVNEVRYRCGKEEKDDED